MNHRKTTERGQALILIALAAIGLFAFSALAIDGSRSYSNKRHAQNAADTSVLAGALAAIRCTPDPCSRDQVLAAAQTAAFARATSNGFTTGTEHGNTFDVKVDLCDTAVPACDGLPAGLSTTEKAQFLRVRIVSTIPTTFGRIIGRQTLSSAVEAVARVDGSSAFSSFPGQAVVALRKTGCGICQNGNGDLEVHGSGVFSNSADSCSMDFWGNVEPWAEKGFYMPSSSQMCFGGNAELGGGSGGAKAGNQISPVYNIPAPSISCSRNGWTDSTTHIVHWGNFPSGLSLTGTWTFEPGNYCFGGNVDIRGDVTASDVNIRIDSGEFSTNGNSSFTCSNVMVYGAGGSGMHLNGNGNNSCTGITFYMKSGDVTWNGNSDQTLKAPTTGDYKGLLIYLPESNSSEIKINGTADSTLTGTVLAPGSKITLKGTSGSTGFDTQIIGSWIDIQGTSSTVIHFNPANQYTPPANPTIQLTK